MTNSNPFFKVYRGAMFSSKTTRLLLEVEKLKHQGKTIATFKPSIDDRYAKSDIVTHAGWSIPATVVKCGADVIEQLVKSDNLPDVVVVDEAFMIDGIAAVLIWLFGMGVSVVVSSLDLSSQGKPLPEMQEILPWATDITTCTAACTGCGSDAYYTYKKAGSSSDEIEVGGKDLYEPRCFSCHPVINQKNKQL